MQRINETMQITWHETCKCIRGLTASVCDNKQKWNEDKCRWECEEDLIDKRICDKRYSWNPNNCECECDKSCRMGEYLDFKTCICRNTLVDKLVEHIDENNY